jgi:uncharacterized protein
MDMNVYYAGNNQITNFDGNTITIKDNQYNDNLIITNDNITKTEINSILDINEEFIVQYILTYKPDIVLFGTGNKIVTLDGKLMQLLNRNNIGCEVMAIAPLCRTFNFLLSEERKVMAIIIFEQVKNIE